VIQRLDSLIHHPRMAWMPRILTGWICDVMDHQLGMTWAEIRRARHGKMAGYTNTLDWRRYSPETTSTAGADVEVRYTYRP
jgi:hypothetical protein